MKKVFLFAALLIASIAGTALAHTMSYNPQDGHGVQAIPVYNNSGSDLDVGDVVVWDIGSSTGDNDAYVTTTTTADTHIVAGVVWHSTIATGETGSIAIYGLVDCDSVDGIAAGGPICSSGTAGAARTCQNNDANFGHATEQHSGTDQQNCFVNP